MKTKVTANLYIFNYERVNMNAESIPGSHPDTNGVVFYHVEAIPVMDYHVHHISSEGAHLCCIYALSDTPEH